MPHINRSPAILFVDKKKENLELISTIQEKMNVPVILAVSDQDAISKSREFDLALAIIDLHYPSKSEYDLVVKLNENNEANKVPILFLSVNYLDPEEIHEDYSSIVIDSLIKPFSKQVLLSKIAVFVDLFKQKQANHRNAELLSKLFENLAKAEKSLEEREQKCLTEQLFNQALIDSIPGIFYLYTYPDLRMVKWNKQHETLFGFEPEEMKGRHVLEWHLPENHHLVIQSLNGFMDTGMAGVETNLLAKDGHFIPFLLTGIKFEIQGQNYLIGVGTDVSKQKKTEEALRKSKEILTKAQQLAHMGSWEYDPQSDQMTCSDETFRIFGYQPREVVPSLDLFYALVHPDDYQQLMDSISEVKKLYTPLNIDLRIVYSNGEQRYINAQSGINFGSNGLPIKWIGSVQDITERKISEKELQKSLEQLHQLSNHIEQARENERLNISRELHDDLGQALTAVKIDLEIIKQNTSDAIMKGKLEDVKMMVGDTIRAVQRITSQLRPEIIDDLGLEAAIDWYSKEYMKRYHVAVSLDIEREISISSNDSLPLFRIMQESLTNIARHSGANQIRISLSSMGDSNQFVVADNGVGISEDKIHSKNSFGIIGMRERAISMGGNFDIFTDDFGTKIIISFPTKKDEA